MRNGRRKTRKRSGLVAACLRLQEAQRELAAAQQMVQKEALRCHGIVSVRDTAREMDLSASTVSNFFRGHLVVDAKKALRLARLAERLERRA